MSSYTKNVTTSQVNQNSASTMKQGCSNYELDFPTPAEAYSVRSVRKLKGAKPSRSGAILEQLAKSNNTLMLMAAKQMWYNIERKEEYDAWAREYCRRKVSITDMPHEVIDNILKYVEVEDTVGCFTDRYNLSLCNKKLRSVWNGERGTLCATNHNKPQYLTFHDMDWLEDIYTECGGYSSYRQIEPVMWAKANQVVRGRNMFDYYRNRYMLDEQDPTVLADYPERTLGGLNVGKRRAMPTRVEREGMAHIGRQGADQATTANKTDPGLNILERLAVVAGRGTDIPLGRAEDIVSTTDAKDILLTESLMRDVPDIRFRNTFMRTEPTGSYRRFLICWGYGLKTLPASGKGAGYTDKYSYRLWRNSSVKLRTIPVVDTGIGYDNRITQDVVATATGNLNARARPDKRDFQSVFDEMKNLPEQFRIAGSAKAATGDNHVAWLTIALARIYGLKLAQEQQARCSVQMSTANLNRFAVDIANSSVGRASVFSGVATTLANTWFQSVRTPPKDEGSREWMASQMYELVLPSSAADESEIIYLAYLSGHLDDVAQWRHKDDALALVPIFNCVNSAATSRFKIPLANAMRPLNNAVLAGWNSNIEVGRAESVFNAYVATHDLQKQVEVAKQIMAVVMLGANSSKASNRLTGLPTPNHVSEYDLWLTPAPLANTTFSLVTQHESACLLAVMLQVQGTMRDDLFVSELATEFESKEVPIGADRTVGIGNAWINKFAPAGPSSWTQAWCEQKFGGFPREMRRILSTNKALLLDDTLEQLTGSVLRVSSLLYNKVVPKSGAIALAWDEVNRKALHVRRFVTGSQAKVLSYLYRGDPSILNAAGVNWIDIIAEVSSRRDMRRMESSLGVRTQNTVVGTPRIIYMGTEPDLTDYNTRMSEAQGMTGLSKHYEPTFDSSTATFFEDAIVPLETVQIPGKRHVAEPQVPSTNYKVPDGAKRDNKLVEEIARMGAGYLGRRYNSTLLEWLAAPKPKKPRRGPAKSGEDRRPLNPQTGAGNVVASIANPVRNSHINGLKESRDKLEADSKKRIEALKTVVKKPLSNVATERVRPEPVAARERAEAVMMLNKPTISRHGIRQKDYDVYESGVKEIVVEGDGRCGVRAIAASLQATGVVGVPTLRELFKTEAEVMSLDNVNRVPGTIMANDYTLAATCTTLGISLCIIHYIGNAASGQKGIRFYSCTNKPVKAVAYVELSNNHYSGLKIGNNLEELLDSTDAGQVFQYLFEPESEVPDEADEPERTLSGGGPTERITPYVPNSLTEFKHASAAKRLTGMLKNGVTITKHTPNYLVAKLDIGPTDQEIPAIDFSISMRYWTGAESYDNAWLEMRKILGDEKLPNEDECKFTADEFIYYCASARLPAAMIEVSTLPNKPIWHVKVDNYTTIVPNNTKDKISKHLYVYVVNGNYLFRPAMSSGLGPMERLRQMRDIKNFGNMIPDASLPHATLDEVEKTHKIWESAVRTRILRMRAQRHSASISCDPQYWAKAFEYRTKSGSTPADGAENNIELLAAFASLYGCNEEAVWFRTEGLAWLQDTVGWLPTNQNWFGIETVMLLALAKGFRVWEMRRGVDHVHLLTEYSAVAHNKTLPFVMEEVGDELRMFQVNLPLRALASLTNLQTCCNQHRDNGTYPEPPQAGPTLPNGNHEVGVQAMSRSQWVLLGFAVGISVVTMTTVAYRKRRSLYGLVAATRERLYGQNGQRAQAVAIAAEASDREPLLTGEDAYANSEFNRGGTPSMMSVNIYDHQAGQLVPAGDQGRNSWDWSASDLELPTMEVVPESWAMALYHTVLGAGAVAHDEL
ncbi:hypothetical protein [Botrytis cinerea botybirnavirus 2]|uniref:F-box domain-containing protein n=1 Tax=Botrytis cinerea botybirnavirus 2 TaxID=2735874 RepID=A0A858YBS6_9VIRU|nr:hypothetical protein [Botrytis cinerea botybirnavirus 2]